MNKIRFTFLLMLFVIALAACAPQMQVVSPNVIAEQPTAIAISTIPANTASISGAVWHDVCMIAGGEGGAPMQPSAGCIVSSSGGYRANSTREADDAGLGDVLVSLGYGACGATDDYFEIRTNADGSFMFANLAAGTYCVLVDSLRAENASLLPGEWTTVVNETGASVAAVTVTLVDGEQKAGINFGWDYQFLPLPDVQPIAPTPIHPTPVPSPVSISPSSISGAVWSDYCTVIGGEGAPASPSGGCVQNLSGGYQSDGLWNNGEAGIGDVTVTLAPGQCPGDANRAVDTVTDFSGAYRFDKLNAGTYCMSVNQQSAVNFNLLIPGDWTFPFFGVGSITVNLGAGENKLGVDFGWDYQFK